MKTTFFSAAILLLLIVSLASCAATQQKLPAFEANAVVPSGNQIAYQQMELIGFIHFTVNTFTDKEWGFGDEDPKIFNPTELNTDQWAQTAKAAGMKELILTAKHHDGFCLWPSQYTEHSVKNSPYKNGEGDVVGEFVASCRKYGLKIGLYLSPWDRNHKDYGTPAYLDYYRNQLTELLTQYGEISEIWFDGANGGEGYYGGANEKREIDRETYYDWDSTFALVKKLQPNILIFSDAGPDIRWVGNEHGHAGETFWSTIEKDRLVIGASDADYLNAGDPNGKNWLAGECDVSIRPGWFYHADQDAKVKTPEELVDIYYKSVGRNGLLLLNVPPDQRGLIHQNDIQSLLEFRKIIDETFSENVAKGQSVEANNYRLNDENFAPKNAVDEDLNSFWATDDGVFPAALVIHLPAGTQFDRIVIQEPIQFGQRISQFKIDIQSESGWETVYEGTTIGYKRIVRIDPVTTTSVRLRITAANNTAAISNFGVFKSSENERGGSR